MAERQDRRLIRLLLVSCVLIPLAARAQPADVPRGERDAYTFRTLTAQVRSAKLDKPDIPVEEGYGFVVGRNGDVLTIVTADHVVRDQDGSPYGKVIVELFINRGHPLSAQLLEPRIPPQYGDMAVLEVHLPNIPAFPRVPVARLPIREGTEAWRIGKQEGWTPSNRPGVFVGRQRTIWLGFDNLDTPRGSSGGPILTDDGLIGMVTDDQSGRGYVLPIDTITEFLAAQGLPWDLANSGEAPRPPDASRPGGSVPLVGGPVPLLQNPAPPGR
jgi:hypothetical protein